MVKVASDDRLSISGIASLPGTWTRLTAGVAPCRVFLLNAHEVRARLLGCSQALVQLIIDQVVYRARLDLGGGGGTPCSSQAPFTVFQPEVQIEGTELRVDSPTNRIS